MAPTLFGLAAFAFGPSLRVVLWRWPSTVHQVRQRAHALAVRALWRGRPVAATP